MIQNKNSALKSKSIFHAFSEGSIEDEDFTYFEDFASHKTARFIASTQSSKVQCLKDMPPEKQQEMLRLYGGAS